ncbi:adenylate/guanylate cyclase [Leptothrix cholodnii SP-6]|uniref:Adenylate/guanylate cyclase n=1 Tax=Leptothrix cholodnii (strain ATCC 51168 / LMG 8142 / SP-6) TaxID=395495 RepID=B1Y6J2_LEPCP|nr:adenylate/guanylate cyclase domain-containing protein [Leptothrix cholodnii]ACB34828.1 adenylate/guanylate cyclase [Leptothrix cholodnii SP-6]
MPQTVTCTVLFADLRGSTSLYESLGNAEAASVVTQSVSVVGRIIEGQGGRVIKTLGDGLMAVFKGPLPAIRAAEEVHESIDRVMGASRPASQPVMRVQIAMVHGEMIEVAGDCFGDAVNVSARLLDAAGDNETLLTTQTLEPLPPEMRKRFRRLERLHLRGRVEPVEVWRLEPRRGQDAASTMFGDSAPTAAPEGIRLASEGVSRIHTVRSLPVIIGRSHEANYCVDDSRVSRSHARIEWHSGNFQLTDLSSNGTYVRFGRQSEVVTLRRGACTLHGRGVICMGVSPNVLNAPTISFEILRFDDTDPQPI